MLRLQPMTTMGMLDAAGFLLLDRFGLYLRALFPFDLLACASFTLMVLANVRADAMPPGMTYNWPWIVMVALVLRTLAQAAYVRCLVRSIEGDPATLLGAWAHVAKRPMSILLPGLISLVTLLAYGVMYLFFAAPCALAFAFASVEGGRPLTTLKRGQSTLARHPYRQVGPALFAILAGVFLVFAMHVGAHMLLQLGQSFLDLQVAAWQQQLTLENQLYSKGLAAVAMATVAAHRATFLAVAYLDARVRTDGFDLRLRLQKVQQERARLAAGSELRASLLRERPTETVESSSILAGGRSSEPSAVGTEKESR